MANLALERLYQGGLLGTAAAKRLGTEAASASSAYTQQRRKLLLERAIHSGAVKPEHLGASDATLLGLHAGQDLSGTGVGRGIGGFLSNLGGDITSFGLHFFPGLYEAAKAGTESSVGFLLGKQYDSKHKDPFRTKVVDPTIESYKQTYGQGNVFKNLYAHPLSPILDALTVASLGAGAGARIGGMAARSAAEGSRAASVGEKLASITSPEGRAPVDFGGTVTGVPRDFSTQPLANLRQRLTDKTLGQYDWWNKLYGLNPALRKASAQMEAQASQKAFEATQPLRHAFEAVGKDADAETALSLLIRGVSTPERLAQAQDFWRKSLEGLNEEGHNLKDFEHMGVRREHVERLAYLSPRIRDLILDPTEELKGAYQAWSADVERGRQTLGIEPEVQEQYLANREEMLGGTAPHPEFPGTYAPDVAASDLIVKEPRLMRKEPRHVKENTQREVTPHDVTQKNIMAPRTARYERASTGRTFMAGAFRTDTKSLLQHAAQRERDVVEQAFKDDFVNKWAAKDHEGNRVEAKNSNEGRQKLHQMGIKDPQNWELIHPSFPIQWYRAEVDHLRSVLNAVEKLKEQGFDEASPQIEQFLTNLQDKHAEAFVKSHWGALKQPGVMVPKSVYNYQKAIAEVHDPFNWKSGRVLAKWMHRWRTATLTMMPRWALNTAVGSFLLTMIRGVFNPRDYIESTKLSRAGKLPAGVELRHDSLRDYVEGAGFTMDVGDVRLPNAQILKFVQGIEDFFRRAQFVHNLKQAGKAREAHSLDVIGEDLKGFYKDMGDKPLVEHWLEDKELTDRAIRQTDRFSYAYSELGPVERRYVRQFVPFWGWYKFITKFVWRLPVEYPGRARIIQTFSHIGEENEKQMGLMPEWVQGSLMLNLVGGKLQYMTTRGVNPLAQFANPFKGMGGIAQFGQSAPLIQAFLSSMGVDTLRGGTVPVSPQSGVGRGIFGDLVNTETGKPVSPANVGGFRRFLMGLARSAPQVRMGEQALEGGPVYPENVPFFADRPMAKSPDAPGGIESLMLPWLGVNIKTYNLKKFQELAKKNAKYSTALNKRSLKRIRASH